MFVRVKSKAIGFGVDHLYDCDRISHSQLEDPNAVQLFIHKGMSEPVEWLLSKKDHEVYIMNNQGQTIDRLVWVSY